MKEAAAFWDKHAKSYAASAIRNPAAYARTLERTRHHLGSGARVLEIGCGTGAMAVELAPGLGHIHGTDVSGEMVRIARDRAAGAGLSNATFTVAPVERAVAESGPVDAILALNVLHLIEPLEALLTAIHDRLPTGGLFISKTVCLADPALGFKRHLIGAAIPVAQALGRAPYVRRMTFAQIETLIAAAGFDIVETLSGPVMSRYVVARRR